MRSSPLNEADFTHAPQIMDAMTELPNRRPLVSFEAGPKGMFVVSVGFDPRTGAPCELFFAARGKSGQHLDDILHDIGVEASKIMQGE